MLASRLPPAAAAPLPFSLRIAVASLGHVVAACPSGRGGPRLVPRLGCCHRRGQRRRFEQTVLSRGESVSQPTQHREASRLRARSAGLAQLGRRDAAAGERAAEGGEVLALQAHRLPPAAHGQLAGLLRPSRLGATVHARGRRHRPIVGVEARAEVAAERGRAHLPPLSGRDEREQECAQRQHAVERPRLRVRQQPGGARLVRRGGGCRSERLGRRQEGRIHCELRVDPLRRRRIGWGWRERLWHLGTSGVCARLSPQAPAPRPAVGKLV
mmetsp:Transcript_26091/g.83971  ORF Transcript_26091/g.83971 Transcript_26091/m.83971 type:complete len:270 (-) Transcript_26091:1418-2227(-)